MDRDSKTYYYGYYYFILLYDNVYIIDMIFYPRGLYKIPYHKIHI